ncbi:MAG TPA: hypothetical protein VGM56_19455, partial [Byssovorax sp.]
MTCARTSAASLALALALGGCSPEATVAPPRAPTNGPYTRDTPIEGAAHVAFALRLADGASFYDAPWPSELRRRDGKPDFRGFPGEHAFVVDKYVETAARDVDGFSIAPAIYFRFDAAGPQRARVIDEAKLGRPPAETMSARAPVFLVDVDPESPERGTFRPIEERLFTSATKYVDAETLAVKPLAGFVLRPSTLYAAVVRRDLGDADGKPLGTSRDLEIVKNTTPRADPDEERARRLHAPVFDALAALGAAREDIAAIAVFRTQNPEAMTGRLLDEAARLTGDEAPRVLSAAWLATTKGRGAAVSYAVARGVYCTPNFQRDVGAAPFFERGGEIEVDGHGAPVLAKIPRESRYFAEACKGLLHARFVVSVPLSPMPAGGFPLMIVGHGTGGTAMSFLGEDDFAGWAAREGVAVVSTDQPIHGADDPDTARPGSLEPAVLRLGGLALPVGAGRTVNELGFYNPLRPAVARDNLRQAAVDAFALVHLLAKTDLGALLARAGAAGPLSAVRFDARRIFYAGHSQGSQSAIVDGALDRDALGVVLSGCGGDVRIGVARRKDIPAMPILEAALGLEEGELDEFHPLLALAQTIADPIDPASYGHLYRER